MYNAHMTFGATHRIHKKGEGSIHRVGPSKLRVMSPGGKCNPPQLIGHAETRWAAERMLAKWMAEHGQAGQQEG